MGDKETITVEELLNDKKLEDGKVYKIKLEGDEEGNNGSEM